MLRIDLPKEDRWIALLPGIRFKVRPLTATLDAAAAAWARARLVEMTDATRHARTLQLTPPGGFDLADAAVAAGAAEVLYAIALARHAIVEWDGIVRGDAEEAVAVSADAIEAVFAVAGVPRAFLDAYAAPLELARQEKKDFGPGPSGTTAAGPSSAAVAAT